MVSVLVSDPIHPDAIELLQSKGHEVMDFSTDKEAMMEALPSVDALIVRSATKVTDTLIQQAPNLKIVGRSGVGLDNIDLEACKKRDIAVVNSPEGPTRSVVELTLGHMIAAARKFGIVVPGTKNGDWPKKEKGNELFGKTLGIIGSGAIGGTLARYALAMGMKVIAYDIIEYEELKILDNFEYVGLSTLFERSHVISVHVPLVPQTKHMINQKAFSKMQKGVVIVNASRGGIIDEDALLEALNQGVVGGAGLDVFEHEPVPPDHPLVTHPLVIATPHVGAQTPEASRNNSMVIAQKIIDLFG